MMDMWLSMNTPSPYEFVIGANLQSYESNGQSYKAYNGEVSAYARFIGLTLEHTNNTEEHYGDTTGIFNLRLFGETVQGSHLTVHYGLRTRIASGGQYRLNQPFPAATLQIYIMKYFGIQGNYRSFTPVTESFYGDTSGDELTYGAFLEFGLMRLFGDIYQERQNSTLGGVETNFKREGTRVGLRFYF